MNSWHGLARLWALVGCFVVVAVIRSEQVGIGFRDPHGEFLRNRVLLSVGVFAGWVLLEALWQMPARWRTGWRPKWAEVRTTIRSRWTGERLGLAAGTLLAYHATYFTYHNLKSWNSFNRPRDAMLAGWDSSLFLGHSPAVLLHDLLGQHVAAWVLAIWYQAFGTVVVLAFPGTVVLARRGSDVLAGMAAFCWVWILGTATYYLIPSLGPFHQAPAEFAGLPAMSIQQTQSLYLRQRAELLAHPHLGDAFGQVAAFASLHVGVSATILGVAWWNRWRRTSLVLAVFLAGTMVATVYLGWHFAVDLLAGLAIAVLAWLLGPLTVGVRRPRRTPS